MKCHRKANKDQSVCMLNSFEDDTSKINEQESSKNDSFSAEIFVVNVLHPDKKEELNKDLFKVSSIDDKSEPHESVSQKSKNDDSKLNVKKNSIQTIKKFIPDKKPEIHWPIQRHNQNFLANFEQNIK